MSDSDTGAGAPTNAVAPCAQCGKALAESDIVEAGDKLFCRSCYASLRAELEVVFTNMSSDVNYSNAMLGALLGGAVGALAWWGFTALTHWSLGLLAILIGYLAGIGAVKFAGGKRAAGLQWVAVAAALLSYCAASYLVNMTFANKSLLEQGEAFRVPFPPLSVGMFISVIKINFGLMDVVFLAIALYEAWKQPRPLRLPADHAA